MTVFEILKRWVIPLGAIDALLPVSGTIADAGCGTGVIAAYLAKRAPARRVLGIDIDAGRIESARQTYAGVANLAFEVGDLTLGEFPPLAGAVISDALHHIRVERRADILSALHGAISEGGVLVVKEIDRSERVRSALSMIWDRILYPKERVCFWTSEATVAALERAGFARIDIKRPNRTFPGSVTLYVCRK